MAFPTLTATNQAATPSDLLQVMVRYVKDQKVLWCAKGPKAESTVQCYRTIDSKERPAPKASHLTPHASTRSMYPSTGSTYP